MGCVITQGRVPRFLDNVALCPTGLGPEDLCTQEQIVCLNGSNFFTVNAAVTKRLNDYSVQSNNMSKYLVAKFSNKLWA
jgi:hypothetical protein